MLLHYSRTQAGVALSSAEAELNAALKMGCEILGISQFCRELGEKVDIKINGDSSAVKGILARRGCGKGQTLGVETIVAPRASPFWKSRIPEDLQEHEPQRRSNTPLHERGCEETLQAHEH